MAAFVDMSISDLKPIVTRRDYICNILYIILSNIIVRCVVNCIFLFYMG